MKQCLRLIFAACTLLPNFAKAQDNHDNITELTTIAGRQSMIGEYYGMNTDCTPMEWIEMIIVTPPAHAKAQVKTITTSANYQVPNPRARCNGVSVPGKAVAYTPDETYSGLDEMTVDRILSSGDASRIIYKINVRQLPKEGSSTPQP